MDNEETHEPTKEELLDRARELNIAGRSSMDKDQLAAAIADHEEAGVDPEREVEEKPFGQVNPEDQPAVHVSEVRGAAVADEEDEEHALDVSGFAGVSPDRLWMGTELHRPLYSPDDADRRAEESRQEAIKANNDKKIAAQEAAKEQRDRDATNRFRDLINGA